MSSSPAAAVHDFQEWIEGEMTADEGKEQERPAAEPPGDERIEGATASMPPLPDSIREAARIAPDHWLGMVDPAWTGEGEPPRWAMLGQWRSSTESEIAEWRENEEYRPSPAPNVKNWYAASE